MSAVRTGLGWDSHRFMAGRPLILGGVTFEDAELGLDGHSDADVLTHAVMDALLGAAGLDDIGVHFPDTDARLRGRGLDRAAARGASRTSRRRACASCTSTRRSSWSARSSARTATAIRERLAAALGLDAAAVNVKASTGEGMGFVGRLRGRRRAGGRDARRARARAARALRRVRGGGRRRGAAARARPGA